MNRTKLMAIALTTLGLGGLTSCDSDEGENTYSVQYATTNLLTPTDGSASQASMGIYTFAFNFTNGTESVATTSLTFNNSTHSFATVGERYSDVALTHGMGYLVKDLEGTMDNNLNISDCTFLVASWPIPDGIDYVPNKRWIPKVKDGNGVMNYHPGAMARPGYDISPLVVGEYKIGALYTVNTFTTDASYFGTTTTSFNGETATSDKIIYRVFIDLSNNTADVVIYDGKFSTSDREPSKPVIYLPGLKVVYSGGNYTVSGTGIVPKIPEGEGTSEVLTDYPTFTFDTFELKTVPDSYLSTVTIDYKVAGKYEGKFTGKYVDIPAAMK